MIIRAYTKELIPDVLDFERRLREEESFWGWEIDEAYIESVARSFDDPPLSLKSSKPYFSFVAFASSTMASGVRASSLRRRYHAQSLSSSLMYGRSVFLRSPT